MAAHRKAKTAKKVATKSAARRRTRAPVAKSAKKKTRRTGTRTKTAKKSAVQRQAAPAAKTASKPKKSAADSVATPPPTAGTGSNQRWAVQADEVGIRVRMYRVGFGDFFLLSVLPQAGDPVHVVIDCGVFKGTKQTGDINSIEAAVADMVQTTGGKLALLIVTHRHADHIAGFARSADAFKTLKIEAIWMSVWESEYSPTAMKFQAELTRTAQVLQNHFAALGLGASPEEHTARKYMENATGLVSKGGGGSNAVALNLLKHGFPGLAPEYYQAGAVPKLPPSFGPAQITAQILGPPPVADVALMKLMDLQKGVGQYLANADIAGTTFGTPFGLRWEIDPSTTRNEGYGSEAFREWLDRGGSGRTTSVGDIRKARLAMEKALLDAQPSAALVAAKQLNSFLNNQSLVVLFTIKGKRLLFVGDAQAGNWEHWLYDTDDPEKKPSAAIDANAQAILTSLDFYKVGHHGSGNATPKAVVEMMGTRGRKFAAMCSTQAGVYGTEDPDDPSKGTEVPRQPLIDKLGSETALVRSDQIEITVGTTIIKPEVDAPIPASIAGARFGKGDIWVDCFL